MDNSEPVAKRRGPQTHSCWSADSSFPPKPPPPTGGHRAQYDGPQSAYLPAQGTGHPTLVGLSRVTPPENRGGLSSNPGQKYTFKGTFGSGKAFKAPSPKSCAEEPGGVRHPRFFWLVRQRFRGGLLLTMSSPDRTLDWGWGFIRFPHTWDGPRLGVSAHERAATIPAIFFHTECNPPRLGPKTRPAPLPTWCTPLTRGLT